MPIKHPQFLNNGIYHIVTRGVEKRQIFMDDSDYYRAIFSLYEFNDENPALIRDRRRDRLRAKKNGRELFSATRELLVEILAFCLMPNHLHLLLRQLKDNGISSFMRKFGAGYPAYFNKRYDRVGHLFQGRFRAVSVDSIEQLKNTFVYINVNPTDLIEVGWKEKGIKEPEKAIKFLENYKWSSYPDYAGNKNFPSLTNREFILETLGGKENCKNFVEEWIRYKGEISALKDGVLE
jgi:putative transposase